ncbi:hypothetical protein QA648_24385 (plasmid) [Rhizobium sp. CB3171]|uniref:hypothetical protein n=1 Tax=unclassified Rhizobium TaxID=2613769 RepID=UPI0021A72AFE|nr:MULTISPECIES: hypothetical protein [Rhizobium]UWU25104.1 hypothetical protein N2601_23495 [Rhizobium tropici]WFU06257.1 hypothetical protein QA648_24385 [Rhizobium sp. CB3171]
MKLEVDDLLSPFLSPPGHVARIFEIKLRRHRFRPAKIADNSVAIVYQRISDQRRVRSEEDVILLTVSAMSAVAAMTAVSTMPPLRCLR